MFRNARSAKPRVSSAAS